jgi:hypothetical protein
MASVASGEQRGCAAVAARANSRGRFPLRIAMRVLLAPVMLSATLLSVMAAGCTPYIPVKDDFGTSALAPPMNSRADIPPEFAEFNAFDPAVNELLANQLCATPYEPFEAKTLGASSGRLVQARGRCRTHVPIFGE